MDEKLSQSFGLSIAFLLPGVVGLYAASFFAPPIREWFGVAATQETTVGGFLFVLLGSVGMGVFLSGWRWLIFERTGMFPEAPPFDHQARGDEHKDRAYKDARAQHYQFYQFYSNTLVALVFLFSAWFFKADPRPQWSDVCARFFILLVSCGVLFLSARHALGRFDEKASKILGLTKSSRAS